MRRETREVLWTFAPMLLALALVTGWTVYVTRSHDASITAAHAARGHR